MTEFGIVMEPSPGNTAQLAAAAERLGFDILLSPDTQNLSPDPIGQLNLAGAGTQHLRVGTGVTNPITRDPAVLASALASLSAETGGRALCGIGRGDSSLAHIGKGNSTTAQLKTFIERLRAYLNGDVVERNGRASQLRWLDSYPYHPVPIDIACTGPKTIQMAVEVGDRISFAVGSAPERLQWAMNTALEHLNKIDRPRESIQIGAYINLVCDEDEQRALSLGKLIAGMVAHFAGLKNAPTDHLPTKLRAIAESMQSQYDMARHAQEEGTHLELIDEAFVDWFSIFGPPDKCIERLGPLIDLGIEHVYQLGGSPVAHPHGARQVAMVEQAKLFASHVMPRFR